MGTPSSYHFDMGSNPLEKGSQATPPVTGSVVAYNGSNMDNIPASTILSTYMMLDEDDMASDSDTKAPSQQSVKAFVNSRLWKEEVRVATTTGGTLATSFASGQTVDGITLVTGYRILIKDQSSASDNGIYTVNASGSPTRSVDAGSGALLRHAIIPVRAGTVNGASIWVNSNTSISLGSTSLTFREIDSGRTPVFKTAQVTLTSAQILQLNATPITLISAPGAGFVTVIDSVTASKAAGTAYAEVAIGEDIALKYTSAGGSVAATLEMTGFANSTAATITSAPGAASLPVANAAIVAHMLTGEITTGNSDFKLSIVYRTLPVPVF